MSTEAEPTSLTTDTPLPPQSDGSLVRAFQLGDQSAAAALFDRYADRVRGLAGSRCAGNYAARFDADDIVQSVFKALFQGIRQSGYRVPADGQLWGLVLVLALNKIRTQVDHHRAAKRNVHRTQPADGLAHPPQDADASADFLRVVLDDIMTGLPESNRQIVQLRMAGYEVKEIATQAGRSRRTVERVLNDFRARLTEGD
jgi:RNA polymerase sigma factor (sigma-70 family)